MSVADSSGAKLNAIQSLTGSYLLGQAAAAHLAEGEENIGVFLPPSVGGALVNAGLMLHGKVAINLNYTAGKDVVDACVAKAGIRTVISSRKNAVQQPFQGPMFHACEPARSGSPIAEPMPKSW